MKHFLDLTTKANVEECLRDLSEDTLVIYSPTSLRYVGDVDCNRGKFVSARSIGKDAAGIEKMCATQKIDKVVGLGGGTAIDIAKYVASLTERTFICVPTMLSTNAFATNKVALIRRGLKITLDAKLPDEIILDPVLISEAGVYNLYGLCDILSIHTALYDWVLADKAGVEKINPEVYERSRKLLDNTVRFTADLTEASTDDIATLFALIGESGHITNLYGSGRPESGSEHIFAKELERRVEVPHGISIAIGITLMSQLQDNYSIDIQNALEQTGVMRAITDDYDLCKQVKLSLGSLMPREDRYTILNENLPTAEENIRLTDMLFTAAGSRA